MTNTTGTYINAKSAIEQESARAIETGCTKPVRVNDLPGRAGFAPCGGPAVTYTINDGRFAVQCDEHPMTLLLATTVVYPGAGR